MTSENGPVTWDFKSAHDFYEIMRTASSVNSTAGPSLKPELVSINTATGLPHVDNGVPTTLGDFDRIYKLLGFPSHLFTQPEILLSEASKIDPKITAIIDQTHGLNKSFFTSDAQTTSTSHRLSSSKMPLIIEDPFRSTNNPTVSRHTTELDVLQELIRQLKRKWPETVAHTHLSHPECYVPPRTNSDANYPALVIAQQAAKVYRRYRHNSRSAATANVVGFGCIALGGAVATTNYNPIIHYKQIQLATEILSRYHIDIRPNAIPTPGALSPTGIHVFVDWSNILVGFYQFYHNRHGIPKSSQLRSTHPPMSFSSLSLVLERGQLTARRVLAGSRNPNRPAKDESDLIEAEGCGYELNLPKRVPKPRDILRVAKVKEGRGNGYATGLSSSSDSEVYAVRAMGEQCVDELLQLKMLESLVDTDEPSTIVLASGDGAEAEFSGGFFKVVLRFLKRGWKVEVVSWRDGLSQEYTAPTFRAKWGAKFQIIELDPFGPYLGA